MKPLDLMKALYDLPEDLSEMPSGIEEDHSESPVRGEGRAANVQAAPAAQADTDAPAGKRFGYTILPYLLTAGCTAACIAGFGLMIRFSMGNEIVGTQSEIPISVQESVSSMTTAVSTGERAVLTAITETHTVQQTVTVTAEDRTEPVSVTETDAVTEPAASMTAMQTETLLLTGTAAAKTQTEPLPLTGTTAAETQTETTAAEPPPLVYEMGDVDMDGQITFVDAALVSIDYNLAVQFAHGEENLWECSPLTPEQRILGNVNGLDDGKMWTDAEPYPLSRDDAWIINHVAICRNWCDIDITVEEYIQDPEFYDALADPDKYVQIYGEAWNQKLLDAVGLWSSMSSAGIGWHYKEGIDRKGRNIVEDLASENKELFMEYAMTVEEFWENTEVMKEQYFKDGWKEALLEENTNKTALG